MGEDRKLKFFGRVESKGVSQNLIWSFTLGDTTNGWFSEKAANQEELISATVRAVVGKKPILLAVPTHSPRTDDFIELVDGKANWKKDSFRIRIFDPTLQSFPINLQFNIVKRVGPVMPILNNHNWVKTAAYKLVKLRAKECFTVPDNI